MVKHTQTTCQQKPMNCLSVLDQCVELVPKGLNFSLVWHKMRKTTYMVPTKKIDSNSRTFQDFFSLFPGLFAAKVQDYSRTFNEIRSCMNSNIYFLQNKNIHPVVYRNNGSFYSKCKKQIPFVIYIIYYYIDLSLLEIDPLY